MEHFSNEFCQIELHDRYAILTINEHVNFTLTEAAVIRSKLREFYKSKDFIMISYRKFDHIISPEIYSKGMLTNMKGLAIVSENEKERDNAIIEQPLYSKPFVFYSSLEEAKSWAKSFFRDMV